MMLDNKQLKKGIIETLVLHVLEGEDHYGYEIIQLIDEASQSVFKLKEGTLYPILYRLEDAKQIESYWRHDQADQRGVKPRKYYRLLHVGRETLHSAIDEWTLFSDTVSRMLMVRGGKD